MFGGRPAGVTARSTVRRTNPIRRSVPSPHGHSRVSQGWTKRCTNASARSACAARARTAASQLHLRTRGSQDVAFESPGSSPRDGPPFEVADQRDLGAVAGRGGRERGPLRRVVGGTEITFGRRVVGGIQRGRGRGEGFGPLRCGVRLWNHSVAPAGTGSGSHAKFATAAAVKHPRGPPVVVRGARRRRLRDTRSPRRPRRRPPSWTRGCRSAGTQARPGAASSPHRPAPCS